MRNVSDKNCRHNQNTHFGFNNFFPESRSFYEIMWKTTVVRQATSDNTKRRRRFECWVTRTKGTHSEYVILIPFPRQPWLRNVPECYVYMYIYSRRRMFTAR